MEIRPLTPADGVAVAPLCLQLGYPSTPDQVVRRLETLQASADQGLLGAQLGSLLVGWVHVQGRLVLESEPFAEVCGIAPQPPFVLFTLSNERVILN